MKKIIYDLGCHNGSNIPYYLLKADMVVAVDANPILCENIKTTYQKEIKEKRLIVENFIITHELSGEKKPFYIFKELDVCSSIYSDYNFFYKNKKVQKSDFNEIKVETKNILDLIHKNGEPFYIKIDLEDYDHVILREIFNNRIAPKYISSECHKIEVFNLMIGHDLYNYFKIVKGSSVESEQYIIKSLNGEQIYYKFPPHSAGPFGEDIKGNWLPKDIFNLQFFLNGGPSWVDIHALRSD